MSSDPLMHHPVDGDTQRARWEEWAQTAEPIKCEACGEPFVPNHPRRRFCDRPECPGRRAPSGPKRRGDRPSGRAVAAARRAGVQGVLADVLVQVHRDELDGELAEVREAIREWIHCEANDVPPTQRRAAVIALCAAAAVRALVAGPPPALGDDDVDQPG